MKIIITGQASVLTQKKQKKRSCSFLRHYTFSQLCVNVWMFHMYSVKWGHLKTFAHGRLYQIMAHIFFSGKIYLFQMGGKPYNFPISSYKRIPPEETGRKTKRGACTFPAQKSSSEGRQPSTLRRDGAENHVAFFSSWKMVSDEWRTWGELLLAKQKVHYSLQQWMPLSYISCWILFLQGPHWPLILFLTPPPSFL